MQSAMGENLSYEIVYALSKEFSKISQEQLQSQRVVKTKSSVVSLLKEIYNKTFGILESSFADLKEIEELSQPPISFESEKEKVYSYEYSNANIQRVLSNSYKPRVALVPHKLIEGLNKGWTTVFAPKPKEEIKEDYSYDEVNKLSEKVNEENLQSIEVPTAPTIEVEEQTVEVPTIEVKKEEEVSFDDIFGNVRNVVKENGDLKKQVESIKKGMIELKNINTSLKEEVKASQSEKDSLKMQVEKLQSEKQNFERELQTLNAEKEKMEVRFREELQIKENEKKSVEEIYKNKYQADREKIAMTLKSILPKETMQVESSEEVSKTR